MITIDMRDLDSADEFYKRLGAEIELPAYFGHNLDALKDVFEEYRELEITFKGCDDAATRLPKFIKGLKRMCGDLAKGNEGLRMEFD